MNCQELIDLLHDYTSGELVVEQHRTVEVHLSECKHCFTLVETYRYTIKLARALPKCQRLPAEVEQRLRRKLARELGEPEAR
jgi:anti-sigma factor RsiW